MEGQILLWIQENLRAEWLTPLVKGITYLGNAGIVWILFSLLLLCFPRTRKTGFCTGGALLLDLLAVNVLAKNLFARTRPYLVVEGLTNLIGEQSDFSFPSGHTAASFAFAAAFAMQAPKKYSVPVLLLAVLISLSRLYVGVHYPTDILGGILIGTACGIASTLLVRKIYTKIKNKG